MSYPASFFGTADTADIIHSYTRAEAIADGVLVDLTDAPERREAGFKCPVACTREVYEECIALTPAAERAGNDVKSRLWDVLWMLRNAVGRNSAPEALFKLYCVRDRVRSTHTTLKAVAGPGDDGARSMRA